VRALTLHQPWAYAVVSGQKTIENRKWAPADALKPGDRFAIHAGKVYDDQGEEFLRNLNVKLPAERIRLTGIVGVATFNRILRKGTLDTRSDPEADNPMFFGPVGWVLEDLREFAVPCPAKGGMGLWALDETREKAIRALIDFEDESRAIAKASDNLEWLCACGWIGDMRASPANASGGRVCPSCGASGGLKSVFKKDPAEATKGTT
jgi:hypothetical protein